MPASSYVARDHAGGAVDTTITGDISTTTQLTISIASAVGWPTGGANGPFHVIVDYDVAGKEKIEVQSRTGTTLTIADTGKRGIDGTAASTHTTGATIRHCYTAIDASEANEHITDTTKDHHTQYLNTARHAAIVHTSAMLGTDSVGSDEIAAGAVGATELATDAVTNVKVAADAINTAEIVNLAVTAAKIANDTITTAQMAADSVGASELANAAVAQANFVSPLSALYVTGSDPGAVGNGSVWMDTTNRAIKVRNAANSAWEIFIQEPTWIDVTPTLTNVTLGTGGTVWGHYLRFGNTVVFEFGFGLGTGGDVTGTIGVSTPLAAKDRAGDRHWLGAAQHRSGSSVYASVGRIEPETNANLVTNFGTAGTSYWDAGTPVNWGFGHRMDGFILFEVA